MEITNLINNIYNFIKSDLNNSLEVGLTALNFYENLIQIELMKFPSAVFMWDTFSNIEVFSTTSKKGTLDASVIFFNTASNIKILQYVEGFLKLLKNNHRMGYEKIINVEVLSVENGITDDLSVNLDICEVKIKIDFIL